MCTTMGPTKGAADTVTRLRWVGPPLANTEVLQLPLDRVHTQAVGQRRQDLQRLLGLLLLLGAGSSPAAAAGRHRPAVPGSSAARPGPRVCTAPGSRRR